MAAGFIHLFIWLQLHCSVAKPILGSETAVADDKELPGKSIGRRLPVVIFCHGMWLAAPPTLLPVVTWLLMVIVSSSCLQAEAVFILTSIMYGFHPEGLLIVGIHILLGYGH